MCYDLNWVRPLPILAIPLREGFMPGFNEYRTRFLPLYEGVKRLHETGPGHQGHGLDHDAAVAMMGTIIARRVAGGHLANMAFCAGMLHSLDHLVQNVPEELIRLLDLTADIFTNEERDDIQRAVLRHAEFKDKDLATRSVVQRVLMDADKLVNMDPIVIVRAGQFFPNTPAIELDHMNPPSGQTYANTASTYQDPRSVLDNLRGSLEWTEPGWMHFPVSQQMAVERANFIRSFISNAEDAFEPLGLVGVIL